MPLIQAMYSNKSNLKFFSFKVSVIYKFNKAQTFDRYIYFFNFYLPQNTTTNTQKNGKFIFVTENIPQNQICRLKGLFPLTQDPTIHNNT